VITFKKFFESNKPLGLIETITFKELGPVEAKIDSGNGAYNVLHGINIQDNREQVTFETVNNKTLTKPIKEYIDINVGSGPDGEPTIDNRPVVEFDIEIGGKTYSNTKFSIGSREDNEYKILVGKEFIEQLGGVIDVSKEGNLD
jgi:hypothetical protein|tara:strand:+ start:936 stop:1367 length:432 start_codon:yes stop_codon:yes gene_type:complete